MNSVSILLNRPSTYHGLGLLATCSALIGPICLEVIYNHADLWFDGLWQTQAFSKVWLSWSILGIFIATPWSLDRGFPGISPEIHWKYSLFLSFIGVYTYIIFSLPTWIWLVQMSLADASSIFQSVALSNIILITVSCFACFWEKRFGTLSALVSNMVTGLFLIYFAWKLIFEAVSI